MIASGPEPSSPRSGDGIDRLFARLLAGIVALSWTGVLLAELGWFHPVAIFALGAVTVGIAWVLVGRALRREPAAPTAGGSAP